MTDIDRHTPAELAHRADAPRPTLDQMVAFWLDAKGQGGASARTYDTYAEVIASARAALGQAGLDLDSDPAAVAAVLARWAGHRLIDGQMDYAPTPPVAASTYNHRLACVSSCYAFAQRRQWLLSNPTDLIDRATVQPYADSRALDAQAVRNALAAINTSTLQGLRDYALLSVALTTGRRRAELARLRWRDVTVQGGDTVTLAFYGKGRKRLRDELSGPVGAALLRWLHAWHGAALGSLPPDAEVWANLSPRNHGHPLTPDGVASITERVLGTRAVHRLRHTFAAGMERSGAALTETQRRLGHSNAATTSRYLEGLAAAENPHAADLARLFLGDDRADD